METNPGGAETFRRRGKGSKNKKNKRDKKNKKTTFDGRQRMMVPRYPACTLSLPGCERAGFKLERVACLIHDP